MAESDGAGAEEGEEISLLTEELIHLTLKESLVTPDDKPTLICTAWTNKRFNPESFKAQVKSIWKTKKKFVIKVVGQNLFLISFDSEEDLELIMEGRPWLFRKSLILFERLCSAIEREKIQLISSPFWLKIGSCSPEFDKKDLSHEIGSTFRGLIRSKINGDICRLNINMDV
ncbi:hypothetical protein J1N35_028890 [Gossypium stocksii]|uniref:DUF4283 domain-containing protein n=1 Tax=Gossypium stocksii TaxID=47602 RepID=A0A9D3UX21_9ROSI|nr:hypothetical protein J1N35_028890 [Gossypium stocksii]